MDQIIRIFLLFAFTSVLIGFVTAKCEHARQGHDTPYCVCSATLKCAGDFATSSQINPSKSVATAFRTTKGGDRFVRHELHFSSTKVSTSGVVNVAVDTSKHEQKILGFGGAFSDSAGLNVAALPEALQHDLVRDYFDSNVGIGYRLGRIVIGGSDFSTRAYSNDDNAEGDETLSKWALQPEDLKYKLPLLQLANKHSNNSAHYFGSAWSAPAWMKINKQLNHGGFLVGEPGTKYYQLYAKYLVKFLQAYAEHNVKIWGLTIINEPGFGNTPTYPFNAMGFSATQERDFVKKDLAPELARAGLSGTKVMVFDDNIHHMESYADASFQDAEAAKTVAGVAFHWYTNKQEDRPGIFERIARKYPDKFMLSTEACHGWGGLGGWNTLVDYAFDIIEDLNHHVAGWVDWNMVLDTNGGPSWVHTKLDAPIIVNASAHEYYKQPIFYAMGHFSKFILPDSVHVHAQMDLTNGWNENLLVTVFQRPDTSKVATILNKNSHVVQVQLHDPAAGYVLVELQPNSLESVIWH